MKKQLLIFTLLLISIPMIIFSCKPINIFSPLIDPSKMGTEANLDAGYQALSTGNYEDAVDYFTNAINNASGDELVDAYLGRASAYMNLAAPNLDDVVDDALSGDLDLSSSSDIIDTVVSDDEFDDFFTTVQDAADDYNAAISTAGSDVDPGVLLEAYEANMMSATGVAAMKIGNEYNEGIWAVNSQNPISNLTVNGETVTFNTELEAIVAGDRQETDALYHPYNISTWEDPNSANNGLKQYVDGETEESEMIEYLEAAYNNLEQLKSNPPLELSASDITNMETQIKNWAYYGLGDNRFGTP